MQTTHVGAYSVMVSNENSSVASSNAWLAVAVPFQNQTVLRRSNVALSLSLNSATPVSYQWRKDGVELPGATNALFQITEALPSHAGTYSVLVAIADGSSTSFSATLSVISALRRLPLGYWPGVPVTVEIETAPTGGIISHTVTERLPAGSIFGLLPNYFNANGIPIAYRQGFQLVRLQPTGINEDGVFDLATGTVKWGPFFDDSPRVLRYTIVPPLGWDSPITFSGTLSEDGRSTALPDSSVSLYPLHPADNSPPADNLITIFELSAYAAAWRRSLLWPVPPNPIKDDYLTEAGAIWKRGEYYENVGGTPPLNWQSAPLPSGFKKSALLADSSGRVAKMSLSSASAATGTAARSLSSAQVNPSGPFDVTITVTPQASVTVLVVEEQLPPGWTASNMNSGGLIDANFNKVKWGPFFLNQSSTPRTYTYQAIPAAGAQGVFTLSGLAAFDGTVLNIGGPSQITLGSGASAPTITFQPQSQTVVAGINVTFSGTASGTAPITYQWRKDAINISSATNASYSLLNVQAADGAAYSVVVSNAAGSATSSNAVLTVTPAEITHPLLRAELSGKEILLSWPANVVGFVLEVSDSLSPASWTRVPQAAALAGASYSAKIPVAGGSKFYRLRGP